MRSVRFCLITLMLTLAITALLACSGPTEANDGPAPEQEDGELIVFAASSLTDAFDEIARQFEEANPAAMVTLNYGSSSRLATQLAEGAQADVFASANEQQMAVAIEAGRISVPTVVFATNRLTVIAPADNPAGIDTLADLAQPGLRLVMAIPGAPVRDYADQMIDTMAADPAFGIDFRESVYANLISEEENVRQVVAKVLLGEADAGIVYTSDVIPDIQDSVIQIEVPEDFNVVAMYPIGIVADASHPEQARAFVDFVLSQEGQAILTRQGFGAAPGD